MSARLQNCPSVCLVLTGFYRTTSSVPLYLVSMRGPVFVAITFSRMSEPRRKQNPLLLSLW